ncbi:Spindle pole body [Olea europaea subsp. europaea]|uniref:Spindle pole body n=2 Tax=Olea europaea subsp. europaea TaxID=158383 RepID=A0A8S0UGC1_OLEEU|nr:Spindle pole body [Olea europaea subsp. europaea]
MGRKLDALLGKGFKTSKFKATLNLALSRLSVLKNQRHARCSVARSDVVEFLNLGHHDRALLRVEQVVKEQNMLDVFAVMEGYCNLLIERINLIEQEKVCPDELKEAASSLIYATTRCGEFPELQEIRAILISRYGKEFAGRAVELRNNCGVNLQIIQKLSTRTPSLENKMKVVKEIASEYSIVLQIEETPSATGVEILDSEQKNHSTLSGVSNPGENRVVQPENIERVEDLSVPVNMRKKYRDVADAAQAAFESAAYAAEAARAAVELSRSGSTDPDDPSSPNLQPRKVSPKLEFVKSKLQTNEDEQVELKYEKIHSVQNYDLENQDESLRMEQFKQRDGTQVSKSPSVSSLDSIDDNVKETNMSSDEKIQTQTLETEIVFDESDDENEPESIARSPKAYNFDSNIQDKIPEGSSRDPQYSSQKFFPFRSQTRMEMESRPENSRESFVDEIRGQGVEHLKIKKSPISVRTRRTYGR